ncbi:uncharacterized protein [Centroberyx affinis]|uniref:uncharacterized protein n=1 Tax=Centroberyx affinis TaxID=166261 RepID=UPI003A5BBCB5
MLHISTYSEQFGSPGRGKPVRPRPSSAHRKNNPHPRPDFLFPRRLQTSHRSSRTALHPTPPVDVGRPLFPPVRHLSFHSPAPPPENKPDNTLNAVDTGKPHHMPSVNPSTLHALPSADGLQQLQLTKPPAGTDGHFQTALRNPPRPFQPDYQRNAHPHSAQRLRQLSATHPQMGLQTSNPPAAQRHRPQTQHWRSRSNSTLDSSGGYSCFHVVKPYQAGHYIIHPEFVSECLR